MENELFEDKEVLLNLSFNIPLKRIFCDESFEIKVLDRNGDKPFVLIRYRNDDTKKD